MKKIWVALLCLALLAQAACVAVAAADDHEHVYSGKTETVAQDTVYVYVDSNQHRATTDVIVYSICDICGERGSGKFGEAEVKLENHTFVNGACVDCNYVFVVATPTAEPTVAPTAVPTEAPTAEPTAAPTAEPTEEPTVAPTAEPTAAPTAEPTAEPTEEPTVAPMPTLEPVETVEPAEEPTEEPAEEPADEPTEEPTEEPAEEPADEPSEEPTTEPAATATAAESAASQDEAAPAPVYVSVSEDTEVNGVKVSDELSIVKALETVGATLDSENTSVTIVGIDKVLNEAEKARFDALNVREQLMVTLAALGIDNVGEQLTDSLSDEAEALAGDITERMENLPEEEKQALLNVIAEQFPHKTVTIDGQDYDGFSIDVVVDRDGEEEYERYTFYNDGSEWLLYDIEIGEIEEAE